MKILEKKTLYFSYDTDVWVTRYPNPDDPWDAGDESGSYHVTGVFLTPGMRDSIEVLEDINVGDAVYVVYVAYDSGSTFGTSGGYGQVIAVTKVQEWADQVQKWAESTPKNPWHRPSGHQGMPSLWPDEKLLSPCCYYTDHEGKWSWETKGWREYRPWEGHFEHNQRFYCEEFVVQS